MGDFFGKALENMEEICRSVWKTMGAIWERYEKHIGKNVGNVFLYNGSPNSYVAWPKLSKCCAVEALPGPHI